MTHPETSPAISPLPGTAKRLKMRDGVVWRIGPRSADLLIEEETPMEIRSKSAELIVRRTNRRWATGEAWETWESASA